MTATDSGEYMREDLAVTSFELTAVEMASLSAVQGTPPGGPDADLVVEFGSDVLRGPKARPATHAVTGLLNGGPEFGPKFLEPLRMGNYRGSACQSPSAYAAMVKVSRHDIAGIWVAFFSRYLVVDRLARRTSSATWISWQRTARHCLRTSTTRACVPSGPDGAAIGARGRRGSAS